MVVIGKATIGQTTAYQRLNLVPLNLSENLVACFCFLEFRAIGCNYVSVLVNRS